MNAAEISALAKEFITLDEAMWVIGTVVPPAESAEPAMPAAEEGG